MSVLLGYAFVASVYLSLCWVAAKVITDRRAQARDTARGLEPAIDWCCPDCDDPHSDPNACGCVDCREFVALAALWLDYTPGERLLFGVLEAQLPPATRNTP